MRWLLLLLVACGSEKVAAPTDGGLLIGDAQAPADAQPRDGGFDASDASLDASFDASLDTDAGHLDASAPDATDPCALEPLATLSSTQAVAQSATWEGQVIEIVGTATTMVSCTERVCPREEPCCNTCSGAVVIDGLIPLTSNKCYETGCAGTECAVTCRPAVLGVPGRYRGLLRGTAGGVSLELLGVDR